jgi:hypothetical protein
VLSNHLAVPHQLLTGTRHAWGPTKVEQMQAQWLAFWARTWISGVCTRHEQSFQFSFLVMGGLCYKWILSPLNGTLHIIATIRGGTVHPCHYQLYRKPKKLQSISISIARNKGVGSLQALHTAFWPCYLIPLVTSSGGRLDPIQSAMP